MQIRYCLYFNVILSNLWQELCENQAFQWAKIVCSPGDFNVSTYVFKDGLCLNTKVSLKSIFLVFKIKLLGG